MAARQGKERRLSASAAGGRLRAPPGRRLGLRAALMVGVPAVVTTALLLTPVAGLDAFLDDPSGTRITDRAGVYLGSVPGPDGAFQWRVGPAGIPPQCARMFVEMEDARFRWHPGVDPLALARAVLDGVLERGARSGASTITMQLARLVQRRPRTLGGKLSEAWDALRIESRLTKDRVLAEYLDSVPFGRNTLGVGAAAWTYFGTDLGRLSRAQLLLLAIIPRNPTIYDPSDHPQRLLAVAEELDGRRHLGVPAAELEAALENAHGARPPGDAPHFVRFVQGELLAGRIPLPGGRRRPPGGVLRTTLDLGLNHEIEARLRFIIARYESARVTNAAVVALDNATGAVLGWVGSRDFADTAHSGQVDGVLMRRQSASTLKPFLYAMALQKGWTAATLLPDLPVLFGAADEEVYRPQNFDKRSHGVVRLRTALASSLNVPAVYTLSRLGVREFLSTLQRLGFSLPPDAAARYGLGTAIGNAEVSLEELARAFSVFPRGGTLAPLVLAEGASPAGAVTVFDPFSAWMICSILSDPSARATGFGIHTYFRATVPSMFKSGTSSEFTNLWCVGATPRYTVGAWAGNFDGRAVVNKTGSIVPTQVVADVLNRLSETHPVPPAERDFRRPVGAVSARIDTLTGLAATPYSQSTRMEFFRGPAEVPPACCFHADPARRGDLFLDSLLSRGESVRIVFPVNGQVFYLDQTLRAGAQRIPVSVAFRGPGGVTVSVDGRARSPGPDGISVPLTRGFHEVTATGPYSSDRVRFEIR
ncbi:MAG TPA: transglycosylase domain-containing protein [Spirochaetia bacterium]|nr:transglycosylase domain-containing protein [Spirochaetia bacterium]